MQEGCGVGSETPQGLTVDTLAGGMIRSPSMHTLGALGDNGLPPKQRGVIAFCVGFIRVSVAGDFALKGPAVSRGAGRSIT